MADTLSKIREVQRKVAAGEIDLRDIGKLLDGKFDQDFPAEILRLAALSARVRELEDKVETIQRVSSPGHRTFDDTIRDLSLVNAMARAALSQKSNT